LDTQVAAIAVRDNTAAELKLTMEQMLLLAFRILLCELSRQSRHRVDRGSFGESDAHIDHRFRDWRSGQVSDFRVRQVRCPDHSV
jgi:hypothetical protein